MTSMANTSIRGSAQARSKRYTAATFAWLNQVNADRDLPPSAVKVALYLSQRFNRARGGQAWPSYETVADAIGVDKATVVRMIRALARNGHLEVDPGSAGRGHSNRYRMVRKGAEAHLSEPRKGAAAPRRKGASEARKGAAAHLTHLEPSNPVGPKGPHREGERDSELTFATPDPGGVGADARAPDEGREESEIVVAEYDKLPKATGTRGQLRSAGPGRGKKGKTGSSKSAPPVSELPHHRRAWRRQAPRRRDGLSRASRHMGAAVD